MTKNEKNEIAVLRRQGLGYKKIAAKLDIPLSTVKSHCIRHNLYAVNGYICIQCGAEITKAKTGRPRKFCSLKCKNDYSNAHIRKEYICCGCGTKFVTRHYGAKYCSHECYIRDRFKK